MKKSWNKRQTTDLQNCPNIAFLKMKIAYKDNLAMAWTDYVKIYHFVPLT